METSSLSLTVTPLQMLLSLAFQIWLVVFPIILIRKVNYLTALLEDQREAAGGHAGED